MNISVEFMYAKIHQACITTTNLGYVGSMGIDTDILAQAGLFPGQRIEVYNNNNGERFATYLIPEEAGSRRVGVYGAAARKVAIGDVVIVVAYANADIDTARNHKPIVLVMDGQDNQVKDSI